MSPVYISLPARSQRVCPGNCSSPLSRTVWAASNPLRSRGVMQPPASPRPLFSSRLPSPGSPQDCLRERGAAAQISSSAFRPAASSDTAYARREDEEDHSSLQLILLLTLSVVLLTLPWVVDHPVTLLVPVALLILPITSGALRAIVSEGFALVFGGLRWFWRHRKSAPPHQEYGAVPASPRQPQPAAPYHVKANGTVSAWHHPPVSPAYTVPQPACGLQQPAGHTRSITVDQHVRLHAPAPAHGAASCDWQQAPLHRPRMRRQPAAAPAQACHLQTASPELSTPDLDFDLESDSEIQMTAAHGHVQPLGPAQSAYQGHYPRTAAFQSPEAQRQKAAQRQPDGTTCNVYNWDDVDCTHRRGHKPLSELLSNGQYE